MNFKILIVENETQLLENLNGRLQHQGYRIESARDWETALAMAHQFRPNLIILDTKLPGINQPDVNRQMRSQLNDAQLYLWSARKNDPEPKRDLPIEGKACYSTSYNTRELPARIKAHYRSAQILQMLQGEPAFSAR